VHVFSFIKGTLLTQLVLQQQQLRVEAIRKGKQQSIKKERINKLRVIIEQVLLALLLLEDGVTVCLVFAQEAVVVVLGGKALRLRFHWATT
jgi:hypothetical protein